MENTSPRIAIIGAGCSGITALKNMLQAGLRNVVCYEQNADVGGNWIYSADLSHSSVCETTHIISSKRMSAYSDFPMPAEYPDYPSHAQVLAYFRAYAQKFALYPFIQFNTKVHKVTKKEDDCWQVSLEDGSESDFDYLLIANGHHNVPRHPEEIKAAFSGEYIHSHQYKTNRPFVDKRVLVVGAGNSACDCAVEISRVAELVAISIRRPSYIVPKFFLGKPTDIFNKYLVRLPKPVAHFLQQLGLRIQLGRYADYGLEQPPDPVTKSHPTLNSELLYKIRHGKVHPRRGIKRIEGKRVLFQDGKEGVFDTLIAATGYKISLPFFAPDFINYEEVDRIPLYLRMFHPEHPRLMFIGLFQPQGAIWPLSDYQSQLAARYIRGEWQWPERMTELAEADSDYIEQEFAQTKRHTIEVHYHRFLQQLRSELAK